MGGVAVVVSSLLLLLWFLDNPYHGGVGALRPVAMERTLEVLQERRARSAVSSPRVTRRAPGVAEDAGSVESRRDRWIEVLATVLLALAAVATAWATYQAAHWRSEQALAGNRSTAARVEANRARGREPPDPGRPRDVHPVGRCVLDGQQEARQLLHSPFPAGFRPAVAAWVATRPLTNPKAPLTPFDMPQYRSAALAKADRRGERRARGDSSAGARRARRQVHALRRAVRHDAVLRRDQHETALVEGTGGDPRAPAASSSSAAAWAATFPVSVQL